jgi:hypothetical protein
MIRDDFTPTHGCIYANKEFTRCIKRHNILPPFGGLEESLIFSPLKKQLWLGDGRGMVECFLSTNSLTPIYSENKRLECPYGPKGKLHLMKSSLVRLPLRRIRRHRTDRLLLYFHMTSTMMPRAPPAVAPLPVLRQNWKTLS